MAAPAVHDGRVDIDVGALERIRFDIVALTADLQNGLDKQLVLRRSMRFVANPAIARCGRMVGLLAHPLLQVFVTGQAHVGRLRQQQFGEFRLMGTMALRAESVLHGFMPAFGCLKRLLCFHMALQTEGALVLEDHPVVVACVSVVAPQAQSFRERRMDGIVRDLFHEIAVTLGAEF